MTNRYPSMQFKMIAFIAWNNLVHKRLRTLLTLFGIVIGVGAVFFLISFGLGVQKLVTHQVIGNKSVKSIDITTSNSQAVSLDNDVYKRIGDLPHVAKIGLSYSFAGSLQSDGGQSGTIVYGVDSDYLEMSNLAMAAGRLLGAKESDDSIVINSMALHSLDINNAKDAIGKKIKIEIPSLTVDKKQFIKEFTIVGVSQDKEGSEVYLSGTLLADSGAKDLSKIKVEADDASNVNGLRSQISSIGLQTSSPIDTVDQINQVFQFFNIILVGFGSIGMVVAILGMFNTMTISLLERTKEIGLMFALGGQEKDMKKLFQIEALILAIVGAVFGVICAVVIGQLINLIMNLLAHSRGVAEGFQLFDSPWWLVIGALVFMVFVGLIVVFIPARRAAHINPIDALRRE